MSTTNPPLLDSPAKVTLFHQVLGHEERRLAVEALADLESPTLESLAQEMVSRNGDSKDAYDIELSLHHNHLPKLVDAGAIEYDPDQKRIRTDEPTIRTLNGSPEQ
jgi:hypothetical protein